MVQNHPCGKAEGQRPLAESAPGTIGRQGPICQSATAVVEQDRVQAVCSTELFSNLGDENLNGSCYAHTSWVSFEKDRSALELLQTKHRLKKSGDLTDSSVDL